MKMTRIIWSWLPQEVSIFSFFAPTSLFCFASPVLAVFSVPTASFFLNFTPFSSAGYHWGLSLGSRWLWLLVGLYAKDWGSVSTFIIHSSFKLPLLPPKARTVSDSYLLSHEYVAFFPQLVAYKSSPAILRIRRWCTDSAVSKIPRPPYLNMSSLTG